MEEGEEDLLSKRGKTEEILEYDEFTNLPNELKSQIFQNIIGNYRTKEEAYCHDRFPTVNKSFQTNFPLYNQLLNKFPTVLEYQEQNIYGKDYTIQQPPYFLTCKDICQDVQGCVTDITRFDYLISKNESYQDWLQWIKINPNEKRFLGGIIWNCPCINVELPVAHLLPTRKKSQMFYEQRLWIQKDNKPWTIFDLINEIYKFYSENFTNQELDSIINLLSKYSYFNNEELQKIRNSLTNIKRGDTINDIYSMVLQEYQDNYIWTLYDD